ncbi:MAG: hypothetical protein ABIA75_01240 [Candidatus Neomarinimicrobiota bacterium]
MINLDLKNSLEQQFAGDFATDRYNELADIYIREGNYVRARTVCEIGLSYHPLDATGLFLLAQITLGEGDLAGAEKILQYLLGEYPDHRQGVHLLVTIQERLNRPPDILRQGWEYLLRLDPGNTQAKVFLQRLSPAAPITAPAPEKPAPPPVEALIDDQTSTVGPINARLATFTLVAVLKDQGLFHQALEVLDVLEEKGRDPERIVAEREKINEMIKTMA